MAASASPDLKTAGGVVDVSPSVPIVLSTASTAPGGKHPGDWTCRTCGYLNFVSRVVCHKCYTPKEHPGKHPGDWICANCGALCFVSRDRCFKCQAPKQPWLPGFPAPGRFPLGFPRQHQYKHPGDWCCPRCFDHVYASRAFCRKCNTAKPQQPLIATPSVLGGDRERMVACRMSDPVVCLSRRASERPDHQPAVHRLAYGLSPAPAAVPTAAYDFHPDAYR